MNKYLLVTLFCILSSLNSALAKVERMSLLEANRKQLITFSVARTNQSFMDKGLRLTIKNASKKALSIKVDPALLFTASDSSYQDLILPGNEILVVAAGTERSLQVQTYCAKSYAKSPDQDVLFTFAKQEDSTFIKTFNFIRKNGIITDLTQEAVWFLTDKNKNLSNVYSGSNEAQSNKLIKFLSELTQTKLPGYYTQKPINTTPNQIARIPKVLKLAVNLKWTQETTQKMNLSIFDSEGKKLQSYFEDKEMTAGTYELSAKFETSRYPQGAYKVKLYTSDDATLITEVEVPLQ